jgi:aryl-alcohol dehydrogenase-like predicted oxidoreductase
MSKTNDAGIPLRPLGTTGEHVSMLGLGGHAVGLMPRKPEAVDLVKRAIDEGVTFIDNAWEYHDGRSEELVGLGIKGRRDEVFLMTKVCSHGRDAKTAMRQLEQSLKRLGTDHLDLWQIHEVIHDNDPELHHAAGGAIEALDKAKEQGKTRFVGFTGHKDPAIHLDMLSRGYAFDTVQLPLNPLDATFRSFEERVLPRLVERGIAPLAMKSLNGTGRVLKDKVLTAKEALSYVWSLPVSVLISGMDSPRVLRENVKLAREFEPLSDIQRRKLREHCREVAADGRYELYKVSKEHDGKPGREQHGFPKSLGA